MWQLKYLIWTVSCLFFCQTVFSLDPVDLSNVRAETAFGGKEGQEGEPQNQDHDIAAEHRDNRVDRGWDALDGILVPDGANDRDQGGQIEHHLIPFGHVGFLLVNQGLC